MDTAGITVGDAATERTCNRDGRGHIGRSCTLEAALKLSARNILPGRVVAITKGSTTAHVKVELAPGLMVTSSITNEAVDDLALTVGESVSAVIKSSDVMIGK
jgi:molybdopterin-binding protein